MAGKSVSKLGNVSIKEVLKTAEKASTGGSKGSTNISPKVQSSIDNSRALIDSIGSARTPKERSAGTKSGSEPSGGKLPKNANTIKGETAGKGDLAVIGSQLAVKAQAGIAAAIISAKNPMDFHKALIEMLIKNGEMYKTKAETDPDPEKFWAYNLRAIGAGTLFGALPYDVQKGVTDRIAKEAVGLVRLVEMIEKDPSILLKIPLELSDQLVNGYLGPISDTMYDKGVWEGLKKAVEPLENYGDEFVAADLEGKSGMLTGIALLAIPGGIGEKGAIRGAEKVAAEVSEKAVREAAEKALSGGIRISPNTTRINIANGRTRFTPNRDNGNPVSAGWQHIVDGHFNRELGNSRSVFSISENELKDILKRKDVIASPVQDMGGGQFRRIVDTGEVVGNSALKFGGNETTWIEIITDIKGNVITTYPVLGI